MNSKAKGSRNEHRSMALLEAAGYRCTRAAASLGAWDVSWCIGGGTGREGRTCGKSEGGL